MFKKIFNCSGYIYKLDASNSKENQTGWSAEVADRQLIELKKDMGAIEERTEELKEEAYQYSRACWVVTPTST